MSISDNPFSRTNQMMAASGPSFTTRIVDFFQGIVAILAILVIVYLVFIIPSQVDGSSMFPTLKNNEVLFTNKLIKLIGGPNRPFKKYDFQRGDIVVFHTDTHDKDVVKRIIGLPGEKVMIENGRVYIDGRLMVEDYIDINEYPTEAGDFMREGVEKEVPVGHYFVLGDNRPGSQDSRSSNFGFINRDDIKGAPFIRIYPLNQMKLLERGNSHFENI